MVRRLLDIKSYLEDIDNENVSLTESQWEQLSEIEKLFSHPFTVTKKLQSEDLTPCQFLLEWRKLIFCLNKCGGLTANGIVSSMKKQEGPLLDNSILLGAIYIDPLSRILLTTDQISQAKKALFELAIRMKGLQVSAQLETAEGGAIGSSAGESAGLNVTC